jgi:putative oxidoreductase
MRRFSRHGIVVARVLISVVFVLNGFAIIDQTIPAKELIERGVPVSLAPLIMLAGRALELAAGFALALGIVPRLAALALLAFLVPATFVSHSFWLVAGTPAFQGQLINFSKNVAIWGSLVFIAASEGQPSLLPRRNVLPVIDNSKSAGEAADSQILGVKE